MTATQATILGMMQGLTEFLPISSSAHLILVSKVTDWPDQGISFDLALHLGTLLAVVWYFWQDLKKVTTGTVYAYHTKKLNRESVLALGLFIGTLPAIAIGAALFDIADATLRSTHVIIATTVIFALLLAYADLRAKAKLNLDALTWKHALYIGIGQSIALIPGVSRSGITITTGLMLGYDKISASRFSFLLAIPITFIAAVAKLGQLLQATDYTINWLLFAIGTGIAFITALLAIHYFLKWLNRFGMMPYVIYRLLLAILLLKFI